MRLLDFGEHAIDEALAEARQRLLDAPNVAQVRADADDHAGADMAARPRARPASIAARIRCDRFLQPDENRLADQEMADIQLDDLGQGGNPLCGFEIEAMAGMDLEAER